MGVWRHVEREDCPKDHRLVWCIWVFKEKRNGVYHARHVAKGFSQIPGMDFTDNYSPVVITEIWILQGIYPLKDEWVFGCSLKTRLADQTKTQQLKWLWSKDSMNSTINQRLVEQTQEMNFNLEGSGGSTLDDTLRKHYLSSSDE